ncbi:class I SAM-dependent methyltransferase [Thermomonospora umbrina]|uniref:Methyltransferase family protein n=1 Tax=Thermomonospora umbrina TaxID=111806 RepID=A0A3D9SFR0_9ACTN|nr:class I SAM-dependent methyltransferase [Thermomonospora umbrina]REE94778.1 methyltransferase family protein [Thermomonospora umbrina]
MTLITDQDLRSRYRADLAQGVARFLEPRRPDCPWCGSHALEVRLTSPDLVQAKPGRFVLERCRDCGHVFQNPRLNEAGLDFYYRDFYDGLGAEAVERGFGMARRSYRRRAEMLRGHAVPRTWLDVGTGYGHFCRTAKEVWPRTRFTGLDRGESVMKARRRGWIGEAHRGSFPELVPDLAGRHDVVSMHHYLEHTTEPLRELDAAASVLDRGGHLLIELPDPECVFGRLLGRYWIPWFQPQHLHLIPFGNLERALAERGFSVVAVERRRADIGHDFAFAAWAALNRFGPRPSRPWKVGPPTAVDRARRVAALGLAGPALLSGLLLDATLRPLLPRHSNTYRVLALRT